MGDPELELLTRDKFESAFDGECAVRQHHLAVDLIQNVTADEAFRVHDDALRRSQLDSALCGQRYLWDTIELNGRVLVLDYAGNRVDALPSKAVHTAKHESCRTYLR